MLELEQINLRGGLLDAQRVRALPQSAGQQALPFLLRALDEGSTAVAVAAMEALGRIDRVAATGRAVAVLSGGGDSDLRAAAADVLRGVETEEAMTALIAATTDSPLVAGSALRALGAVHGVGAARRVREQLVSVVDELSRAGGDERRVARLRAAALGTGFDGNGLLRLVVRRSFGDMEAQLVAWWRRHPDVSIKAAAAGELIVGGVQHALSVLNEGLPGANAAAPREPLGELDNADVRLVLAMAAHAALTRLSPSAAFDQLSPLFDAWGDWFSEQRAEIVLLLLLGQLGLNPTSWLYGYARELGGKGAPPDRRWGELNLAAFSPMVQRLGAEVRARLQR